MIHTILMQIIPYSTIISFYSHVQNSIENFVLEHKWQFSGGQE